MKKIFGLILLGILVFSSVFFIFKKPVRAEWTNHVVISEFATRGLTSAADEFVELYNPALNQISLAGWKLQYKPAQGGIWSNKTGPDGLPSGVIIQPHSFYLLAGKDYTGPTAPDWRHTASWGFADDGHIRLVDSLGNVIDLVGYGMADSAEGNRPAPNHGNAANNKSVERRLGGEDGNGQDTNVNEDDFFVKNQREPDNLNSPARPSLPPPPEPQCGNGVCESGENYSNCPQDCFCGNDICDADKGEDPTTCLADCPVANDNNSGNNAVNIYVPHQVEPGDILINEIFPEPNATKSEGEWIEFYNHTDDAALDLTGWTLEDNTAKPIILAGIILAPRQYYALDKSKFSFALNNGGDTLILKNNQVIIDQVAYGDYEDGNIDDNAPAPGLSKSVGRRTSEPIDTNNDKNDFSICQSVTPGRANDVKIADSSQPTAVSSVNVPVIISEFLPNPGGSDNNEWIELYNPGLSAVDLTGWQADDGEGGSSPYTLPSNTTIAAGGYLILPWSQTKIVLNNNFDAVRLIRPDKVIKEQINYKDPPEGASYARDSSDSWEYTSVLTPGSANIFNVDDIVGGTIDKTVLTQDLSEDSNGANLDLVEVDNLPQLENGQAATIQGLVVAPPNLFAKSYFYLNGAQIYSFAAKFPDLQIGDLIEVKGIVSASFSNRRLKIKSADDIQVLEHQNLSPQPVAISELDDSLIGHFLQISGQLVDKTGSKLYLDDNQEEVEVYLSPAIKWNKNLFTEGQNLRVSGILAETKEGWRLLPRCDNDLVVSAATIDNFLSDSQNQATVENQNNPSITKLASSTATVWQNLNRPAVIKYLFLSAGVIIIFLVGVFLKLRGVI